jgi:hypothetical protein
MCDYMYLYFTFNNNDLPAYLANVCAKGADGSGVGTDPLAVIKRWAKPTGRWRYDGWTRAASADVELMKSASAEAGHARARDRTRRGFNSTARLMTYDNITDTQEELFKKYYKGCVYTSKHIYSKI